MVTLVRQKNSDSLFMGMLDRYKKKGGFSQLLQLLETSPTTKREQFLGLIAGESPAWEEALRKRILTINRVYAWEGQYLVEILSRVPPLTLASSIHGNPSEQIEGLLNLLPPISKRKIVDLMGEMNPTAAEKATSISKLLAEVRGYIAQGILRLEKVDPELIIPENIEEILSMNGFSIPSSELELASKGELRASPSPAGGEVNPDLQHEIEFLRKKIVQFSSEVNALKQENSVLKDKLSQIKRIA